MSEIENDFLLKVEHLSVRFSVGKGVLGRPTGRVHAVEDVSLKLHAAETLSLVGESGCGKSTVGKALLGLVSPVAGQIYFNGQRISARSRAALKPVRRNMQLIFQDAFASLNPRMRVGDAIGEPLVIHDLASGRALRRRICLLIERVGLEQGHYARFPHELSGGQRQRVCIARAIALEPKIVIADEAVSALDVTVKARIINLLIDLQRDMGLAYLFISHDMAVVERISHRVAVMYLGRIVEFGNRRAVFENPTHPYTQKLLKAVPVPDPGARKPAHAWAPEELPSPLRPLGYEPSPSEYDEVSAGHFIARGTEL